MAYFGVSKLEAVNFILQVCKDERASALSSSGSWPSKAYNGDDVGQVEADLDREKARILSRGFQCNTARNQKFSLASQGSITLTNYTLKIIPTGPSELRRHSIKDNKVWDLEPSPPTDQLAPGDYFYHVITDVDFESLEPTVKHLVMVEAARVIQRRRRGDPKIDAYLADEVALAEINVARSMNPPQAYGINQQPLVPRAPEPVQ